MLAATRGKSAQRQRPSTAKTKGSFFREEKEYRLCSTSFREIAFRRIPLPCPRPERVTTSHVSFVSLEWSGRTGGSGVGFGGMFSICVVPPNTHGSLQLGVVTGPCNAAGGDPFCLSTTDIWGQRLLCWGGCPGHCRELSAAPLPSATGSQHHLLLPGVTTKAIPRHRQTFPGEQNYLPLRTMGLLELNF